MNALKGGTVGDMPTWLIVAIVAGPIPVALIGGYLTTPKGAWKAKRPWHEKKD